MFNLLGPMANPGRVRRPGPIIESSESSAKAASGTINPQAHAAIRIAVASAEFVTSMTPPAGIKEDSDDFGYPRNEGPWNKDHQSIGVLIAGPGEIEVIER